MNSLDLEPIEIVKILPASKTLVPKLRSLRWNTVEPLGGDLLPVKYLLAKDYLSVFEFRDRQQVQLHLVMVVLV